jgi:hypothetical protein
MITVHATHAQASLGLADQITARFGDHPGALDLLSIVVRPVRGHAPAGTFVILAFPRGGPHDDSEILAALFSSAAARVQSTAAQIGDR